MISLGEVLKNVPDLGTAPQVVEQIDIDLIESDPANFYQLTGIDELAANIELMGLQQPIVVKTHPEDPGKYMIVSGHRRRAAIAKLVAEGREDLRRVPCLRQKEVGSPALQKLALIYANSDTRTLTSAEISKQAERVEALLYALKEEGMEFPGRMRDHVAEACKVSKSKLSRLKVIREKLTKQWRPSWEAGKLSEATAYALAQMPEEYQYLIWQRVKKFNTKSEYIYENTVSALHRGMKVIDDLVCTENCGGPCINGTAMKEKVALNPNTWGFPCEGCCLECSRLAHCKQACVFAADRKRRLLDNEKAERTERQQEEAEKDARDGAQIRALWARFGVARHEAGASLQDCADAIGYTYAYYAEKEAEAMEAGDYKFKASTDHPYRHVLSNLRDVTGLVSLADRLGVSIDYLLLRTDVPEMASAAAGAAEPSWIPMSQPPKKAGQPALVKVSPDDGMGEIEVKAYWGVDGEWHMKNSRVTIDDVLAWWPLPED